jgi:hypothetical protein
MQWRLLIEEHIFKEEKSWTSKTQNRVDTVYHAPVTTQTRLNASVKKHANILLCVRALCVRVREQSCLGLTHPMKQVLLACKWSVCGTCACSLHPFALPSPGSQRPCIWPEYSSDSDTNNLHWEELFHEPLPGHENGKCGFPVRCLLLQTVLGCGQMSRRAVW